LNPTKLIDIKRLIGNAEEILRAHCLGKGKEVAKRESRRNGKFRLCMR